MRRFCPFLLLTVFFAGIAHARDFSAQDIEFFEKEVRPLLINRCFECHGDQKHKGHLRLDSREAVLKGGETGPAAIEGKPADSLMIKAINYIGDVQMPPKSKISEKEIKILTRWVELRLPWPAGQASQVSQPAAVEMQFTSEQKNWWAFQPLSKPKLPKVKNSKWARTDIDRFILAQLDAKKLKPAASADKRALLRRATYDLTGLPPTAGDMENFLRDNSPNAFAKVVDRLLESPQYGERWGRHWLDIVRYTDSRDSRGSGGDGDTVDAWKYRDWVVKAFNKDMPYTDFIVDQIAGDILPPPENAKVNVDGLIATTFLSIGEWGAGDADKEKMMTDIVDDQIDVVSRGFMGVTMACARCHDHKFDPLSTRDYYGLAGIFFSTHIIANPGAKTDGTPNMRTPLLPADEVAKIKAQKNRSSEVEKLIKQKEDAAYDALAKSFLPLTSEYLLAAREFSKDKKADVTAFAAQRGLHAFALDGWAKLIGGTSMLPPAYPLMSISQRDVKNNPGVHVWKAQPDCPNMLINTTGNPVRIGTLRVPPDSISIHPGPSNGVAIGWTSPFTGKVRISGKVTDSDGTCGDGVSWAIDRRTSKDVLEIASGKFSNGGTQTFDAASNAANLASVSVEKGETLFLLVLPKGEYTCDTTTVEWNIEPAGGGPDWKIPRDLLADPLQGNPHADTHGNPGVWQLCDMGTVKRDGTLPISLKTVINELAAAPDEAAPKIAAEFQKRVSAADAKDILIVELAGSKSPFYVGSRDNAKYLAPEVAAEIAALRSEFETLKKTPPAPIPTAEAAQEGGVPSSRYAGFADANILARGSYTRPGVKVPRGFPKVLAGDKQPKIEKGSGRLELARWIASPENPLTARVMANRIWQYHFGDGIVRTASNYGKLGERPTHPELLDFLAQKFIDSGWSVKTMHRLMMNSAVYQQSSIASRDSLKVDPENRLLSHMNRRRLQAEELRDSVLTAAGNLDTKLGGPPERDAMTKRRMLYLVTIRSDRSNFGSLFDAADPTAQVDRRVVSTVAPQALYLLNSPFVAAQLPAIAGRFLAERPDDSSRISYAYEQLYGRPARPEELELARDFLASCRGCGDSDEKAWTAYAQILICGNEFMFVD